MPKQSGTVWSELQQGELDEGRVMMLESLFANEGSTKKTKEAPKTPSLAASKKGSTATLSVGRANNVSIMMTRFRHFSGVDEICRAVLTGKGMTDEELNLLSQVSQRKQNENDVFTDRPNGNGSQRIKNAQGRRTFGSREGPDGYDRRSQTTNEGCLSICYATLGAKLFRSD